MKRFSIILLSILLSNACINNSAKKILTEKNLLYDTAHNYLDSSKVDSAFLYFNRAKDVFLQQNDSLGVAKCLINMAIISTNKADYFGGQEISFKAIPYLNRKKKDDSISIRSNLNNLGIATSSLGDYSRAINFYEQSLEFINDTPSQIVVKNNIANAYGQNGNYEKSISLYTALLKQGIQNKMDYAKVLTNWASVKWLYNPNYIPISYFLKALEIRAQENDIDGLHSSYGHLSDYYEKIRPDSALFFTYKMYDVAKKFNNASNQLMALKRLIKLSPPQESKNYFLRYEELNDSVQLERSKSKNQFAIIRYETEKHKAEKLVLQKDVSEKKYQIISLIVGMLMIMAVSIILYKKRKQRMELVSQNAIRENQLNTSKKVHDRVANRIYSVISEIENKKELDKDNLLDKLDHIYQTSRDISYEITDSQQGKKFSQQLSEMFYTYVADPPRVKITGNDDEIWADVSNNTKGEIFIVLQELMTNMKKHSQATQVEVEFYKKDTFISIHYHDNGVGFPKDVIHHNGLRNTETRIKNISGTLTFETIDQLGLDIRISFPVN